MDDKSSEALRRITIELDRLGQEISAAQHVVGDAGPNWREETVRRLGHIGTRAARIAAMVDDEKPA
jgi:hypothetical protein